METEAWRAAVHGVVESDRSDWTELEVVTGGERAGLNCEEVCNWGSGSQEEAPIYFIFFKESEATKFTAHSMYIFRSPLSPEICASVQLKPPELLFAR